jgi:hypothetical protein
MQVGFSMPAIRHGVITIGLLYEDFASNSNHRSRLRDNALAIQHYNLAIRELRRTQNVPLILMACLIFVCIELIQGSEEEALNHLQSGLRILHATPQLPSWAQDSLGPIYQRQRITLLKFGRSMDPMPGDSLPRAEPVRSIDDARALTDCLYYHGFRLVTFGSMYRHGDLHGEAVERELLAQQTNLLESLRESREVLLDFARQQTIPSDHYPTYSSILLGVELGRIGAVMAFSASEMGYDKFTDTFKTAVEMLGEIGFSMTCSTEHQTAPIFRWETGYIMSILSIIFRCRHIPTRLRALALLKRFGSAREGFWDTTRLWVICRRLVEVEHDMALSEDGQPQKDAPGVNFPPDEKRVRHIIGNSRGAITARSGAQKSTGAPVAFVMGDTTGRIYVSEQLSSLD